MRVAKCAATFGPVLLAFLTSSACVVSVESPGYTTRDEKRFTVSGTPEVSLVTFDGAIEIRGWDRSEVVVAIEKRGHTKEAVDAIEIKAEQTGNRIWLEARRPAGHEVFFRIGSGRSAKLIASVPRQANLMARSGDGSITIERMAGRMELRTGDGSIRGVDLNGDLSVHTGDGSVKLEAVDGRVDLTTGDGGIDVAGKLEAVRARTGDGSVVLRAEAGSTMADDWDIDTGDGGVVIYLPGEFNADVDAHTGDGTVRTDSSIKIQPGEISRRTIRGKLGSGGRVLRVRTGDGSINLRAS